MSFSASKVVIRAINPYITTFSAPFTRSGSLEIGVRMTAIKTTSLIATNTAPITSDVTASHPGVTTSNDLIIYNPIELDEKVLSELQRLGQPRYIVLPNEVHHSFLENFASRFPDAQIIASEGMQSNHQKFKINELTNPDAISVPWGPSVELAYFPDMTHKEIILFHKESRTLIVGDMVWNMPPNEQYSLDPERLQKNSGMMQNTTNTNANPGGWMMKAFAWAFSSSKDRFKAQVDRVVQVWQPDALIMQHGDVIQSGALPRIKEAFSYILNTEQTGTK